MEQIKNCDLKSCSLCKNCMKEWLPALDLNRTTLSFKKGETLFKEGDPISGIYFIKTGSAKVHKQWDDKELIIRFAGADDIIGHRGINKEMVYPVSGTALEPLTACLVETNFFLSTLKVNHEYAYKLLMFYTEELQESERNMHHLAHMPVKGRIAYCLVTLIEKFGMNDEGVPNINISRQDLASYAGTTYETAFRTMNQIVDAGVVAFKGKKMMIKKMNELKNMI